MQVKFLGYMFVVIVLAATFPAAGSNRESSANRYISGTGDVTNQGPFLEALRQGLRKLGYVEGKNFVMSIAAQRGIWTVSQTCRRPCATQSRCNGRANTISSSCSKQATKTIPIVMVTGDPVAAGIVDSLAAGRHLTGLATLSPNLSGKRLEFYGGGAKAISPRHPSTTSPGRPKHRSKDTRRQRVRSTFS